ncbi:MAG: tetratricopeptide repeat protein [Alphaproteobacteria bacterium]|nr:tetratricopeptide repeat protein [Alphaproteobacteria bacterium]
MKRVLYIALFAALTGCAGNDTSSDSMVRIAQKARNSGNTEAAVSFYNKAISIDSSNALAYLGLAETYIDMNLLDAAEEHIKKAEASGISPEKANYLRGKIFLLRGDTVSAEKAFLKCQSSTDALNALGAVYDGRGEHARAQKLYKQVIARSPNYIDAYNNMGLSLMLEEKYKEAIFYLENACSLPEANAAYRSNLALAYGLSGQIEKAKIVYQQDYEGKVLENKIAYLEELIAARS